MKTIKIAHLYYDLLNLYGEQGNIMAIKKAFNNQNIDADISLLSVNNKISFDEYDIFYIGSGSKENMLIALDDILKYKKEIRKAFKDNKYFIATGNSHELFGKYIEIDDKQIPCLDLFDYYAKENNQRIVGDIKVEMDDLKVIGFQNRRCLIHNENNHLFKVLVGTGDNFKSEFEGYHENNFYGTYIIGPLLIRNPRFTNMLVEKILTENNLKYHEDNNSFEEKAYEEYIKNFYEQS